MLTLSVKWLNGDIQKVEVPKKSTVLNVIQKLGLSPAETTLFVGEKVLEHYQKVNSNLELSILVQPVPVSIFLYQFQKRDYYFSSEDSMDMYQLIDGPEEPPVEAPFKLFDPEVVYDRVYFDMWSYREREKACSRLDIPLSAYKGIFSMANAPYEFYSIAKERRRLEEEKEEGGLLRWQDFLSSIKEVSHLRDADKYFPTLSTETKRNGLFSCREWMSYFVMKGKK